MRLIDSTAENELAQWLRTTAIALTGCWLAGGVLLLIVRRLSGAFDAPLATMELAAVGFALGSLALSGSALCAGALPDWGRPWNIVGQVIPLAIAALGAAAVSLPRSPVAGLAILWTLVAIVAVIISQAGRWGGLSARLKLRGARTSAGRPRFQLPASSRETSQLLVRFEEEGQDIIRGSVRAVVPAGGRSASAHVAFCPPFFEVPHVTIRKRSPSSEPRVNTGQVLPHGARFDVKFPRQMPRQVTVRIDFSASAAIPTANG